MTLTLGQLIVAEPVLVRLAAIRLPVKTMYALAKLVAALQPETAIYHAQRNALLGELGTVQEATAPETTTIPAEHVPTFLARMRELEAVEVEVADRLRLPFAMLEPLEMSAQEFLALRLLVTEPNGDQ